jgi:type III secretory pathway component EscR
LIRKQAKTIQRKATLTVKELREFLDKYQDEDCVRFFTDKGTRELPHFKLIQDDILYRNVAIIEVD